MYVYINVYIYIYVYMYVVYTLQAKQLEPDKSDCPSLRPRLTD